MTIISVIIPTYNAQRTILATIKSVQQQTYKDIEIIVINDGSSDRTLEVLETVNDRRLKVYSFPNGGLPTARNRGITLAKGEYLSFIDADDLWTPDKLEKQLAALQAKPEASVAYSWTAVMLESENYLGKLDFFSGKRVAFTGDVYAKLLVNNFVGNGSNILIKREAIDLVGNFDPSFKSCEDWDYYLRLAAKCRFVVVPEHQILYRKTAGTMSSKGLVMETEGLKVIDKVYQTVPQKLQHLKKRSIANFYLYCGKIHVDCSVCSSDLSRGKAKLAQAIALDPLILFSSDTYILLSKILLKQLLPDSMVKGLISVLKKPFAMKGLKQTLLTDKQ
jgi:glycosyltransferase involved in cell wall biosynthesis